MAYGETSQGNLLLPHLIRLRRQCTSLQDQIEPNGQLNSMEARLRDMMNWKAARRRASQRQTVHLKAAKMKIGIRDPGHGRTVCHAQLCRTRVKLEIRGQRAETKGMPDCLDGVVAFKDALWLRLTSTLAATQG